MVQAGDSGLSNALGGRGLVDRQRRFWYPPATVGRTICALYSFVTTGNIRGRLRVQVLVRDNNVDQALRALKKKMQREGIFREMKLRGHYEKPSEKKAREKAEAVRRARKLVRKRMQREGLLPSKPRPQTAARPR
jgi:small subunit ribosomal protein S21